MIQTELDALLERVRADKADPADFGRTRNTVAYDCWRMFEDLATRYKEEFAMRDRYKRQSNSWRDKALRLHALLCEVDKLDDGDEPFAWKHGVLFNRIHAELNPDEANHASDCASWVGEPCDCVTAKAAK